MALPATDTFTGSDATELPSYSANWVANGEAASLTIRGNAVAPDGTAAQRFQHWQADAFAADQYSQITITQQSGSGWLGPAVRCSAGATNTGYGAYSASGVGAMLLKVVAGTFTQIAWSNTAFAASSLIRMEAESDDLRVFRNGVQDTDLSTSSDTSIASGYAGLVSHSTDTAHRGDNWEGGNLGAVLPSENLYPDTIAGISNLTGTVDRIDDDPSTPDGNWLTAVDAAAAVALRVRFPTPPGNPTGTQRFNYAVRKTAGAPNPTLATQLYQNGSETAVLATGVAVTNTTGQELGADWNASQLVSVLDGSDVELQLAGTPGAATGTPAYVQAGTGYGNATLAQAHSVPRPAGATAGNLLIAVIQATNTNGNADATVTTAGWTAFPGNPYAGTNNRAILYWKIAAAGTDTAGGNISVTGTGGTGTDGLHARIFEFSCTSGFSISPIESIDSVSGTTATGSTTIAMPTVAAGGTGRLAVAVSTVNDDAGNPASATGESGGNWTQAIAEFESTAGSGGTIDIQTADMSAGGTISGGAVAYGATGDNWVSVGFAIVPEPGSAVNTIEIGACEWVCQYTEPAPGEDEQPFVKRLAGTPFATLNAGIW